MDEGERKAHELEYGVRNLKESESMCKREIKDKERLVRQLENTIQELERTRSTSSGPNHYYGDGKEVEQLRHRNYNLENRLESQKRDFEHAVAEQKRLLAKKTAEGSHGSAGYMERGIRTIGESTEILSHVETIRILQETIRNLQKELHQCKTEPPSTHPLVIDNRRLKQAFSNLEKSHDELKKNEEKGISAIEDSKHLKEQNENYKDSIAKTTKDIEDSKA